MSYSIIRVEKVKSGVNTTGIQKHVQRENKNYNNQDIDFEKTHLNYDLINEENINYRKKIEEKIEENYNGKRKIRNDAVKHIDGIITSDDKFFENKSHEEIKSFFENTKEFLEQEYGEKNLLYATVHFDEKVPHMHFGLVPITEDGRLSAKDMLGNKKAMTEFQDRFNNFVNERGFDMERGTPKQISQKKSVEINAFKQQTNYHREENERESQKLARTQAETLKALEEYEKLVKVLKEPIKVSYEVEKKQVGGFFNKTYEETGNVVIKQEDYQAFEKQITASRDILDRFEYLNSGNALNRLNELDKENKKLKEENKEIYKQLKQGAEFVKDFMDIIKRMMLAIEKHIGRNGMLESLKPVMNHSQYYKNVILKSDMENHPERYKKLEESKQEVKKDKGIQR